MQQSEHLAELLSLRSWITSAATSEIPSILGTLEQLRALAWIRLLETRAEQGARPETDQQLLTIPEAAAFLAIRKGFCYELARRGVLPIVRLGKKVRVPRWGLSEWLK